MTWTKPAPGAGAHSPAGGFRSRSGVGAPPDGPRRAARVPAFQLYGEAARPPVARFVHAERIRARAPMHGWRIEPHRHPDLSQAFLVTRGGGVLEVEGDSRTFSAPWLLWMPSGLVHGFRFEPGTEGHVLTVADDFLSAVVTGESRADLAGTLAAPASAVLAGDAARPTDVERSFREIRDALGFEEAGARVAVEAHLKLILVALARAAGPGGGGATEEGRASAVFRAFRRLVEARFQEQWPVARYAAELGLSVDRLHDLCVRAAGTPPRAVIQTRVFLEAQRALLYTTLSVSEIAYDLGFRDPAYFSRFFKQAAGRSPAAFRAARGRG